MIFKTKSPVPFIITIVVILIVIIAAVVLIGNFGTTTVDANGVSGHFEINF